MKKLFSLLLFLFAWTSSYGATNSMLHLVIQSGGTNGNGTGTLEIQPNAVLTIDSGATIINNGTAVGFGSGSGSGSLTSISDGTGYFTFSNPTTTPQLLFTHPVNTASSFVVLDSSGNLNVRLLQYSTTRAAFSSTVLQLGFLAYATDTGILYIGDGSTAGGIAISGTNYISSLGSNMTHFSVSSGVLNLDNALGSNAFTSTAYVPQATTVNGHPLSSNVVVSASDLTTGTLPTSAEPAHTGDVTNTAGSLALTLASVNSNVGSYTNANLTVNAKGLITAVSNGSPGLTFTAPLVNSSGNVALTINSSGGVEGWDGNPSVNGQVLSSTTSGTRSWITLSSGFTNPMTSIGDFIYGGASGAATRLPANTSTANKFVSEIGTGSAGQAPTFFDLFNTGNTYNVGQAIAVNGNYALALTSTNSGSTIIDTKLDANLGTGNEIYSYLGQAATSNNALQSAFYYSGSGSSSNFAQLSLIGSNGIQIFGSGDVSINSASSTDPGVSLKVSGTTAIATVSPSPGSSYAPDGLDITQTGSLGGVMITAYASSLSTDPSAYTAILLGKNSSESAGMTYKVTGAGTGYAYFAHSGNYGLAQFNTGRGGFYSGSSLPVDDGSSGFYINGGHYRDSTVGTAALTCFNSNGQLVPVTLTTTGTSGASSFSGTTLNIPQYAAGTGTVSSVTFTGDGILDSSTPSTAVTTSGTVTATPKSFAANTVVAGPTSGASATPTARALVAADIPALSYAPQTSGSSLLYGNGSGGFSNATVTSPLTFTGGTLSSTALVSPMTTLGDIIYENATPAAARLAGTTSATKQFLTQAGTGSVSAAPAWGTIAVGDVPTLNQNTTGSSASVGSGTYLPYLTVGVPGAASAANVAGVLTGGSGTLNLSGYTLSLASGQIPNNAANTTGTSSNVTGIVAVANGGTGTATPAIVAGTNVTVSGSFPNQTINATQPTSLPPSGTAGGDLGATYPNPTVTKITGATPGSTTSQASLQNLGAEGSSVVAQSVNFTIAQGDAGKMFNVTTGTSAIVATLPSPSSLPSGWVVYVRKADTGSGTIANDAGTYLISSSGHTEKITSDGTNFIYRAFYGAFNATGDYTFSQGVNKNFIFTTSGTGAFELPALSTAGIVENSSAGAFSTASLLTSALGGTGVNNGSFTLTLTANSTVSGANTGDQTAGTGLTLTSGAFSVNSSQNIATLSNLSTNGLLYTSGGTGTLNSSWSPAPASVTSSGATSVTISGGAVTAGATSTAGSVSILGGAMVGSSGLLNLSGGVTIDAGAASGVNGYGGSVNVGTVNSQTVNVGGSSSSTTVTGNSTTITGTTTTVQTASSTSPSNVVVTAGAYTGSGTANSGGSVNITGGATSGTTATSAGGTINITGGAGNGSTAIGGGVSIQGGYNSSNSARAPINIGTIASGSGSSAPTITIGVSGNTGGITQIQSGNCYITSPIVQIKGTVAGTNQGAGYDGEYVNSLVPTGSSVSLTTATAANITSISLTAGDWDVIGCVNFAGTTATTSQFIAGISTTSATLPTDGSESYSSVPMALVTNTNGVPIARVRINVTTTTTVYLVGSVTFTAGTEKGFGTINARRVR